MKILVLACVTTLTLAVGACVSVPKANVRTPPAAPDSLARLVEHQWKGASLAADTAAACPGAASAAPAATNTSVVTGDFNGDGYVDIAGRATAPDGAHVVAAIARTDDDQFVDVGKIEAPAGQLTVAHQGEEYYEPGSQMDFYFGTDTIVWSGCAPAKTAFMWNGDGFTPVTIAAIAPSVPLTPPAPGVAPAPGAAPATNAPPASTAPSTPNAAPMPNAAPAPSAPAPSAPAQPNSSGAPPASK